MELYCFRLVRPSVHPSASPSVLLSLLPSHFNRSLPNFIYGLLPSNSSSSSNTDYVRRTITKMADKMYAAYLHGVVVTLTAVIFNAISFKFHIWIAYITILFKFEYGFCIMNDNQDGQQNGRRLSVCTCALCRRHSNIRFLSNLIYGLLPSTPRSSSNTSFV